MTYREPYQTDAVRQAEEREMVQRIGIASLLLGLALLGATSLVVSLA